MAELQIAHHQLGFSPLALLGDWVDSIGHEVSVVGLDAFRLSLSAEISWNSHWSKSRLNKWEAKLKIWIDQYGIWSCGNGFLDTRVSSPARLRWCCPDGTCSEWIRTSQPSALVHFPHASPGSGATTADALPQINAKYEVDSVSISLCSACSSSKTSTSNAVRYEVEDEIHNVLTQNRTLQRQDFDGRVRQYLHAIRNVGGKPKLREAMWELHESTVGKSRRAIQKWPAYLKALMKRFFAEMSGKEQQLRRLRRLS